MLTHPTLDQLNQLNLYGMAKAFGELIASAEAATLTHAEWLALLLDREMTYRCDRNSPVAAGGKLSLESRARAWGPRSACLRRTAE